MKKSQNVWVGTIALVIVVVLGIWWLSSIDGVAVPALNPIDAITGKNTATSATKAKEGSVPSTSRADTDALSIARNVSGASEFAALLNSTGVASEIKSTGQYTIFVPRDTAFARLPKGSITGLSAAEKKRLVEFHVVSGRAIDPDAVVAGFVASLSRDALNFTVNSDGSVSVGTAKIVTSYKAKNGYVYVIDGVLFPPKR